jgi:hypothetical protein
MKRRPRRDVVRETHILLAGGQVMAASENRVLPDFDRVDLRGVGTVVVRQSAATSVTVQAAGGALDRVRTEVRDGQLIVGVRWWSALLAWKSLRGIEVRVEVPRLRALIVSGAGNIVTPDPVEAEELELKLSGAGSLEVRVKADRVVARLSGAGTITAAGSTDALEVSLTGAGRFSGPELEAGTVRVRSAGAGETVVFAARTLDVTLTGAGSIRYRGNPQVTSRISGIGSVRAAD